MGGLFNLWDKECVRCGKNDTYPNISFHKHHTVMRSHGGKEDDTVWLCSECHRWVHSHVKEATELGLLVEEYKINK